MLFGAALEMDSRPLEPERRQHQKAAPDAEITRRSGQPSRLGSPGKLPATGMQPFSWEAKAFTDENATQALSPFCK